MPRALDDDRDRSTARRLSASGRVLGLAVTIEIIDGATARTRLAGAYGAHINPDEGVEPVAVSAVRHAAARVCPCPPRTLASVAATALSGIVGEGSTLLEVVKAAIEALIGSGDLIAEADAETGQRLIYLSPPLFVRTS